MHALWALVGGGPLTADFHGKLLVHEDATYRAWGVRAAGNFGHIDSPLREKIVAMTADPAPEVRLQVAIAARKIEGVDAIPVLLQVLDTSGDDKLLAHIVWQNLYPLLEDGSDRYLQLTAQEPWRSSAAVAALLPRVIDCVLDSGRPASIASLVRTLSAEAGSQSDVLAKCLSALAARLEHHELSSEQLGQLRTQLDPLLRA